ncbi:MAG: potassium transporter TrkG, partial [Paracoccaceae bacterium]
LSVSDCIPLVLVTPSLGIVGAWFAMVAALTTTGGSAYARVSAAPDAVHLWRGLVGWFGGLLTLMAAYVVLAPRRLGGFEVLAAADGLAGQRSVDLRVPQARFMSRSGRALKTILPVYAMMTVGLALIFNVADKPGLVAAVHAMSIVSTSGISPVQGGFAASGSFWAELAAAACMVLAASRVLYRDATQSGRRRAWLDDPELRLMAVFVTLATALLFLRHWVGVLMIDVDVDTLDGLRAFWGALFTTISFMTTTGFESFAWESARDWSGLANPGLILLALCTIGGAAATTAGGVKLIRAYALIRHGTRELERIAMPSSVAGAGAGPRGLRREGAFIAWAFMMLFIIALMVSVLALTLSGMAFDTALIAAIAALSNTGPAFAAVAEGDQSFATLTAMQRAILAAAMFLGRVETLAAIALFNPGNWQRRSVRSKKTGNMPGETPLSH